MNMRNCLAAAVLGVMLGASACANDAASDDPEATNGAANVQGQIYGQGVGAGPSVPISELLANPTAYEGQTVRVEGTVTDVCPKRGCWFEMAGDQPGEKMRFKVQDGVMVFPMDAKGQYAVAEGVVYTRQMSLEETRRYLEYQAREYGVDVDPASVTEPMTMVRLDGVGAAIRESR